MPYVFQEYPKILYHHKKAPQGKKFEKRDDEPQGCWARRGWVDTPAKFPNPSRLKTVVKPWWDEWSWIVGPINALLVITAAIVELVHHAFKR